MRVSKLIIAKLALLNCLFSQITNAQNWGAATPYPDPNGPVWSMAEMNNELYVGGEFTMIGGVVANHIAKWNGSSWSAVGGGFNEPVTCMIYHNNKLYVGHGNYSSNTTNIEVWDGAVWSIALSGSTGVDFCIYNGQVLAMTSTGLKIGSSQTWSNFGTPCGGSRVCVFNNEVYVANTNSAISNGIAKWNGSNWIDVAGAVATEPDIRCMEVFNNKLIVGGIISSLGGITVYDVAQFDGSSWSNVGFQDGLGTGGMSPGCVVDLYTQGTHLYMLSGPGYWSNNYGGYFSGLNRWDGNVWQNIGANSMMESNVPGGDLIINYSGNLIVGGHMSVYNPQTFVINNFLVGINNYFTSVPQTSEIIFSAFPNPTLDNITVTWATPNVNTLTLSDATGRAVRTYNVSGTQAQLSLEGVLPGIYFLIDSQGKFGSQKIIVQ